MATKKVIFFTAGAVPTENELAEIAVLQAASTKPFDLAIRRGDAVMANADFRYGAGAEACDYVAGSPPAEVPATPVPASKAGTFSGTGTAADTITIGSTVYELVAAPADPFDVDIGADAAGTAANLAAAINAGAGAGTAYGTGTTAHPTVTASVAGAVVTVTAKTPGAGGNSIALAESGDGFSWAGAASTLTGGGEDGFYALKPEVITSGTGDTVTVTTVDGELTSLVLS